MTPLVLIPGMMCDARLFSPQIGILSGRHALHLAPISAHDSIENLAADVLAGAPPIFALAGLSMGGIVAMEILAQAPERVERIALLNTNPRAETEAVRQAREPQIEKVRAGKLCEVFRDEMKPNYLYDGQNRKDILELCMDMAAGLGAEVFIRQSRALQTRKDQRHTLKNTKVPALDLCGAQDQVCPVDQHELIHALMTNSMLVIVEKAGHLSTLEQPEAVNSALLEWLDRTT